MLNATAKMSCLEFVTAYSEAEDEAEKTEAVDKTHKCLQTRDQEQTQILHDFIDDFVASEEYAAYVKEKQKISKCSAATQCHSSEVMVECRRQEALINYPLTAAQKKMVAFERHFAKFAQRTQSDAKAKKQERSIQIIKGKIAEARKIFECTTKKKQAERGKLERDLLQKYSVRFGIDLNSVSAPMQLKLLAKFKKYHQKSAEQAKKRQQNWIRIVEKLVQEYQMKKPPKPKQKPEEQGFEELLIVGTKIKLETEPEVVESEPDLVVEAQVEAASPKKGPAKKLKAPKQKTKQSKAKKPKTTKAKPKKQKLADNLVLPTIPLVNTREKLLPKNILNVFDLIEQFKGLDCLMENRDLNWSRGRVEVETSGLVWEPSSIQFENFNQNQLYSRTVIVRNVSGHIRKIRFHQLEFPDEFDQMVFNVKSSGIQKLYTGSQAKFSVEFEPFDSVTRYSGKLVLLSLDTQLCEYSKLEIPIQSIPKCSQLSIERNTLHFGQIPMWKASDQGNFQIVKFSNHGLKACTVSIRGAIDSSGSILEEIPRESVSLEPLGEVGAILSECLEAIDKNFRFEIGFFRLGAKEEKRVPVHFTHASYIGDYSDKFAVNVYEAAPDGDLELASCQTISLFAETTGHFLSTHPEVVDFGVCMMGSCYQLSFQLLNGSNRTQAISVRVPAGLKDVVRPGRAMVYMPPNSQRTITIKLIPRELLYEDGCQQFDKSNSILSFNIHLLVVSKPPKDYPPVKVPVYAIVANFQDVTISCPATRRMSNFLNTVLIDMGDCSIYETVWTEIYLTNNTALMQVCAFMDLPQAVVLEPSFGFCKLLPGQRRKFKLYISPEVRDFPSYSIGSLRNRNYFFKLMVDTVTSIGQVATGRSNKAPPTFMDMGKQLALNDLDFLASMTCVPDMKVHSQFVATDSMMKLSKDCQAISRPTSPAVSAILASDQSERSLGDVDTVLNYQNFLIVETTSRREVWLKVNLKRPLLEFSHQLVEFPDTAPGSYSTMEVTLSALEHELEKLCWDKKSASMYRARFTISGDSTEIVVQPSCGVLEGGESLKITLVAQPQISKEIVEQTAQLLKTSQLKDRKLPQSKRAAKQKGTKKSEQTTGKKPDKKKEKPLKVAQEPHSNAEHLDLYPAEMAYWGTLEPYHIRVSFTCTIDYEHSKGHKRRDKLHLDAICKVVRPDFITDLRQQRIDFGKCLISTSETRTITIKNISYRNIRPKVSLLNPAGAFRAPFMRNLAPEACFKLPICFRPSIAEKVTEFMEIGSNATLVPLVLFGEGVLPVIRITPANGVFRVETKRSKLKEVHLKIENASEAPASVRLEKVFEVEGVADKERKERKGQAKVSDSLSEKELESIERGFSKVTGPSHFAFKPVEGAVKIPPTSTSSVTIQCGDPDLLKKNQEAKHSKRPTKDHKEGATSVTTENEGREEKLYIAQFNICIGTTFIQSAVVVCTIKS